MSRSRTKFLVETMANLKNNKIKQKNAGTTQSAANEAVERMKKYLAGLSKKHHGPSTTPQSVTFLSRCLGNSSREGAPPGFPPGSSLIRHKGKMVVGWCGLGR